MLPITLYKNTSRTTRLWKCSLVPYDTDDNAVDGQRTLLLEHGTHNGVLQQDQIVYPSLEDALSNAKSRTEHKLLREGYSESPDADPPGDPMLAHQFREHGYRLPKNCYFQPKLDGFRCVATRNTMFTRKKVAINSMPHIQHHLTKLPPEITLDGELYLEGKSLQQISALVRPELPVDGSDQIEYHIFDLQNNDKFEERHKLLSLIHSNYFNFPECPIKLVPTHKNQTMAANAELRRHLKAGYEGIIIRSPFGVYETDTRSYNIQKYKPLYRAWFNIDHITAADKGREKGLAIVVCRTFPKDGFQPTTFRARLAMDATMRAYIFDNRSKCVPGAALIEFSDFTDKMVPSHPRCLEIHNGRSIDKEKIQEA